MSAGQGSEHGWWQASDGNWYPPDQHPDPHHRARFAAPPPRAKARTAGPGTGRIGAPAVLAVLAASAILVAAMVAIVVSDGGDEAEQVVNREPTDGTEDACELGSGGWSDVGLMTGAQEAPEIGNEAHEATASASRADLPLPLALRPLADSAASPWQQADVAGASGAAGGRDGRLARQGRRARRLGVGEAVVG